MASWLTTESNARRIAVIGSAGGGKSTLARKIAASQNIPYVEVDRLLWQQGWQPADPESYALAHGQAVDAPNWVIDGLGRKESIPMRLQRSTDIILVDLPLWIHFWLAAERQIAWSQGPDRPRTRPLVLKQRRRPKLCSVPSGKPIRPGCRTSAVGSMGHLTEDRFFARSVPLEETWGAQLAWLRFTVSVAAVPGS